MAFNEIKETAATAADAVRHEVDSMRGSGFLGGLTGLRNRFLAGFAVAIPLIVTVWLLVLSYRFILYVGRPVIDRFFNVLNWTLGRTAAAEDLIGPSDWLLNVFGILTPILIFITLGAMATNVIGSRVLSLMDQLMLKFPVVSYIYSGLKQVMNSFKSIGSGRDFKRVAYVEYPSPGCRLIGFVTGQYHDAQMEKGVTSIFIPTAPNPMTGFVIIVENDHVFDSSLTIEQATKIILSAGLVSPEGAFASKEMISTLGKGPGENSGGPGSDADSESKVAGEAKPAEGEKSEKVSGPESQPNGKEGLKPSFTGPLSTTFGGLTGYEEE